MSAESTGFTPPPAFGPFRVLHQIGSGVLGPVFRTYDPQNDRLVAVKAFRLDVVPEDVAKLADALRHLASAGLTHQGLVRAIDAGLEGTSAYVAMEYVSAETLDVALRHLAPSPLDRALPLITDMAEAIEVAWAAGYGHGSLHPRDVFVASGTNDVRITGFGVGQALESAGIKVPARRPYSAPERSAGGPWDIRADVYSLGAIAHELLTKRRPGGAGDQDGSLVTGTTPEQRRLIRGVLGAALAEAPEHRFHSARAFANALAAIVRGEPVGPLPDGSTPGEESKPEVTSEPAASVSPPPRIHEGEVTRPLSRKSIAAAIKPEAPLLAAAEAPMPEPQPETPAAPVPAPEEPPQVIEAPVAAEAAAVVVEPDVVPAQPVPPDVVRPHEPVHHVQIQHVAPISAHHAPPADRPRILPAPMFGQEEAHEDAAREARFPWLAFAAAILASLAVGSVGGYWLGSHQPGQLAAAAAPSSAPAPAPVIPAVPPAIPPGTDVVVPKETPPTATPIQPPPEQKAPPPAPVQGKIAIKATPAGSTVKVDGHAHGAVPVTVTGLAAGAHTVEISHAGYVTKTERVGITGDDPTKSVTVTLLPVAPPAERAPAPATSARGATATAPAGSIYLDSRPPGATILLDGKDVGKTPLTLSGIKPGTHSLRFQLAGYKSLETSVGVRTGQQERVTVTLEQALGMALRK